MVELFRHCPSCGRRFHVNLETKKMVHLERRTFRRTEGRRPGIRSAGGPMSVEGKPITVEVKEFEYTYKCGRCGHEWSEKHTGQQREN